MADATEHGEVVLAAIIPGRKDLLDKAQLRLTENHFVDSTHRRIFRLLGRYADTTGVVLPLKHLEDMAKKSANPEQVALLLEMYETLSSQKVDDADFYWSVQELQDAVVEKETLEVITDAATILRRGLMLDDGTTLKGQQDARNYLLDGMSRIDHDLRLTEVSEGDMKDEEKELLSDYAANKRSFNEGTDPGINFGVETLDAKVGGLQRGNLCIVAGYSSDGKTTLTTQLAWSAAVEQGKNVVFFTTETLRNQVRRKIIARHSVLPVFGLKQGLNPIHIRKGTLSQDHEKAYQEVVKDITNNPTYGRLYLAQVPRGATISTLEAKMRDLQRRFDIDLVLMDYLALLAIDKKRVTQREELSSIIKEAKQVATTFNDSLGVPFVSPWQTSREAYGDAMKVGQYTSRALSETAEATNSADVIITILGQEEVPDPRRAEVTVQVLKNRDGEKSNTLPIEVDYATAKFVPKGVPTFENVKGTANNRFF